MAGFYSLQIARTALFTSQKALEVTGHNIANANTKGFTRQRLELAATPSYGRDKFDVAQSADVGTGVNIVKLDQIRNQYLDAQYRRENAIRSELDMKSYSMKFMEGIFSEPSEHGVSAALSDFFNSFEEMSKASHIESMREIVVQTGVRLTETFRTVANDFINYQHELNRNITLKIDEVNNMANKIADLNKLIFNYELSGKQANDLRDQRNLIVDELSELVTVSVKEEADGNLRVNVGGIAIVDGIRVNEMEYRATKNCPYTGESFHDVFWAGSANKVDLQSGQIKGMLDVRDGAASDNKGIPYYLNRLDTLAKTIVVEFNSINQAGYTLPYGANPSQNGVDFFIPENTTALSITISPALIESGYNIAASDEQVFTLADWSNNKNSVDFIKLRDKAGIITDGEVVGNIESYFQKTLSDLAITTGYFENKLVSHNVLADHLNEERLSVSEVSLDEEMISLVQYQHSYQAAARFISIIDMLIGELINIKR